MMEPKIKTQKNVGEICFKCSNGMKYRIKDFVFWENVCQKAYVLQTSMILY